MAGTLDFVLGLQVNKFLEGLHLGEVAIIGLEKAGEALQVALEKTWGQIEKGAALNDLSKRTGESVETLYKLQKGFSAAGVSSESVTMSLFQLNKSLGGINEMGEDTASVFAKVGLSVDDLKKMGGADALTAVLEKMSKMNQSSATKFGATIFGRGAAGDMVQISRSLEEFEGGMKRAEAQAKVFQRVAAVFDTIEKAVARVKAKLDPVFLVIAEHIAPALESVLAAINNFDISPIVSAIGTGFDVIFQAFKEGKLTALLSASFGAAVEFFGNFIFELIGSGAFWKSIWDTMVGEFTMAFGGILKLLLNIGIVLKAALSTAFDQLYEQIGKTKLGKMLGIEGFKSGSFADHLKEERQNAKPGNDLVDGIISSGASTTSKSLFARINALKTAAKNATAGPQQDALNAMIADLSSRVPGKGKGADATGGGESVDLAKSAGGSGGKSDATALEKLGFVFAGGGAANHAATTAQNTTEMKESLKGIHEAVTKGGGLNEGLVNTHA